MGKIAYSIGLALIVFGIFLLFYGFSNDAIITAGLFGAFGFWLILIGIIVIGMSFSLKYKKIKQ